MSEVPPPPIVAPPVVSPPGSGSEPPSEPESRQSGFKKAASAVGVGALLVAKFGKGGLLLLKAGKVLPTLLSMILSIWVYSLMFGWSFAAGFVICILVHELGHVYFAWKEGVPVSAPLFIPGFGALIIQKQISKSAYAEAKIGIGGPLFGTAAGLVCWGIFGLTGDPLYLALAYTAFFLNLFNLAPVYPLDGGWITACISPYLLIVGYVGYGIALLMGWIHTYFLLILIILSIPRTWQMLKAGTADLGDVVTTKAQKTKMGLAYVGLAAFLSWGMSATHDSEDLQRIRQQRSQNQVAMVTLNSN